MTELRSIRPLSPESMRGVETKKVGRLPMVEWIDPRSLYVEDTYQRGLNGENSTTLIRKIIAGFDWSRFKPPVCVRLPESGNVLVCIDGQHTATAAATHPGVAKIPVLVVDASDVALRAKAFVGHNRDRIALTQMAIYRAELAAGDELAKAVASACMSAGVTILAQSVNLREKQPVGSTIAVGTLRTIAKRDGDVFLARVLRVLVKAERGPVKAGEISAVAEVLSEEDRPDVDEKLRAVIASKSAEQWAADAAQRAVASGEKMNAALARLWTSALSGRTATLRPRENPPAVERKAVPRPAPTEPARTPSPAKPAAPIVVPRQPAEEIVLMDGKPHDTRMWGPWNGVTIDLRDRRVLHRMSEVVVSDDGVRMVAALARVKPALLPAETLAKKTFGKVAEAEFNVRGLVLRLNPVLAGARLEVRTVGKMGYMLADLDA